MPTSLFLHCGADGISEKELKKTVTPEPTETHFPVPHHVLLDEVKKRLKAQSIEIKDRHLATTKDGARFFGVLNVEGTGPMKSNGSCWSLGVRNAHDQSFAAGLCFGQRVFVCDNLAFNGAIVFKRKHTRHVLRDIPRIVTGAVMRFPEFAEQQKRMFDEMANIEFEDEAYPHDLIVRAMDRGIVNANSVPRVLRHWREPEHEEFQDRTVWSLFNAFTSEARALQQSNPVSLSDRTIKLTEFLTEEFDLTPTVVSAEIPDLETEAAMN